MSSETTPQTERGFQRIPAAMPVLVEIAHAWGPSMRRAIPGTLRNISQGGAGVTMAWAVPPSTRVVVLVPTGSRLRLPAEIVWNSAEPGGDPGSAIYGLRWMAHLPEENLDLMASVEADPQRTDSLGSGGAA